MKNIKYTTKYLKAIKTILMAVAFIIIFPSVVSAQVDYTQTPVDYTQYPTNYTQTPVDYTQYPTNYTQTPVDYTQYPTNYTQTPTNYTQQNIDLSSSNIDLSSNQIAYNNGALTYPNQTYTQYGLIGYGNNYGYGYGNGYGYGGYGTVSSGGYTGGNSTFTGLGTYPVPGMPTTTSGGFIAGTSTYTGLGTYNVPGIPDVTSGGYSGGDNGYNNYPNNYIYPVVYNNNPTLTSQLVPNQVLAYTDTNPSLDSVYLSDVPATGFSDYYGILIFISILLSWSAILAYVFLKRKIESQTLSAIVHVNKRDVGNTDNFITSNLLNKIISDNSDINKVEEYARTNKVLLSSEASIKIVKLSRLGQINVSEYIRSIAKGEWIAVGANQIV